MLGYGNSFSLPKSASGLYSAKSGSGSETRTPQPPILEVHSLLRHWGHTSKNGTSGTRRGVHSANNCGISSSDVSAHVKALGATWSPKLKTSGKVKKKYQNKIKCDISGQAFCEGFPNTSHFQILVPNLPALHLLPLHRPSMFGCAKNSWLWS